MIGVVLIGRNEGERLVRCLASVRGSDARIVYVDSGSTDDSIATARAAGSEVVELDLNKPFTAARARNAGFARLFKLGPMPDYVQFVDGDCELHADWVATAQGFLDANPRVAAVCGRRRERFPEASVYNRLCDREWDTPIGQAKATGGDVLMRTAALQEVGGFNPSLIAGEEPELCVRLRKAGWEIWRLNAEMTLHDAAMTRFGQWWKRARRGGHAYAEGAALHGSPPERHGVAGTVRALAWGLVLPVVLLLLALFVSPWMLLGFGVYFLQVVRLAFRGDPGTRVAWEDAFFSTFIKIPETIGVLEYAYGRIFRSPARLIEYK